MDLLSDSTWLARDWGSIALFNLSRAKVHCAMRDGTEIDRQTEMRTDIRTDRQTERKMDKQGQTGRQKNGQTKIDRRTNGKRQTNKQIRLRIADQDVTDTRNLSVISCAVAYVDRKRTD